MAKQTVVTLTDDIDGSEAAETIQFGIDGYLYSIDLSAAHAEEIRDRLTAYQELGSRLGRYQRRDTRPGSTKRGPNQSDRQRNRDIRRWASEHNLPVKARGKLPDSVVAKYEAARA